MFQRETRTYIYAVYAWCSAAKRSILMTPDLRQHAMQKFRNHAVVWDVCEPVNGEYELDSVDVLRHCAAQSSSFTIFFF